MARGRCKTARVAEEPEEDEHHYLGEPCHPIVEAEDPLLEDDPRVPDHDPSEVDREEATPPAYCGEPIGGEARTSSEERGEARGVEGDPGQERGRAPGGGCTYDRGEREVVGGGPDK